MRRIYNWAKAAGLLCPEWARSLDDFIPGVERSARLPPTLRHRLVTTGEEEPDDLLTLKPGNVKWWTNQSDGLGES